MLVATAKLQHAATRIVTHFELVRHFDAVYGAEPGGRFDRKADLLGHLIETGVIRAETSVMVGDRDLDIAAARAHRIRSIGALWGYGDRRELAERGRGPPLRAPARAGGLPRRAGRRPCRPTFRPSLLQDLHRRGPGKAPAGRPSADTRSAIGLASTRPRRSGRR